MRARSVPYRPLRFRSPLDSGPGGGSREYRSGTPCPPPVRVRACRRSALQNHQGFPSGYLRIRGVSELTQARTGCGSSLGQWCVRLETRPVLPWSGTGGGSRWPDAVGTVCVPGCCRSGGDRANAGSAGAGRSSTSRVRRVIHPVCRDAPWAEVVAGRGSRRSELG